MTTEANPVIDGRSTIKPGTKLRDVLPREANQYDSVRDLMDEEVVSEHDGFTTESPWPGPHRHVAWWWTLASGKRVGWNENPAVGWSFPVLGKARKAGGAA